MNEELHHLLDGDLPDGASAELFRSLAGSGEHRELFREQVRLQGALYRNECHGAMTADEEMEMLSRMGEAIDVKPRASTGRKASPLAFMLLGIGLLIGGGAGYMAGENGSGKDSAVSTAPPYQAPAQQTLQQDLPLAINRDSIVAAIRDSVTHAMNTPQNQSAAKRKVRPTNRGSAVDDDPTGAKAAQRLAKEKAEQSQKNE